MSGGDLGEIGREENMFKIYCMKKFKERNKEERKIKRRRGRGGEVKEEEIEKEEEEIEMTPVFLWGLPLVITCSGCIWTVLRASPPSPRPGTHF